MRAFYTVLSRWRPMRGAMRCHSPSEHAEPLVQRPLLAWLRACDNVRWLGCLRLPLCLTDSTFVVDNIRCQHSPPTVVHPVLTSSLISSHLAMLWSVSRQQSR